MVHCYKNNGYNIVLDSNSGSVHAVDEVAFEVIDKYESRSKEEIILELCAKYPEITADDIEEIFQDIEELKKEGKLFSEDKFKDLQIDIKARPTQLKALCLHIAHDCNMCCKYCFAGEGEYSGDRSLMSFEVGKRALDFLIEQSGSRKNLEVDFFGGEPLLNFDVVKQLVAYARSIEKEKGKNFRFTLTTNGVLLDDEVMEWANKECYNVVLSLDGRKETNDRMRRTRNDKGTYDLILPKFQKMAKERNQQGYYIRGTYTHYNTDFANDILHLADMGFEQLAMEPVVTDPKMDYALQESDIPKLKDQYDLLAKEMCKRNREGKGFTFFHYMIDLEGGPCIYKRISGCGVGTDYMAVTPWGDLYPCHQFVGDEKFLLGNVFDGVKNTDIVNEFKLCNVYSREACQDCFAKLYCSGGCSANAYHTTGKITGTCDMSCELHRKRVENAIMIKIDELFANSENNENNQE
ncbi:MAG: thioether cross-link-forming SCIFF peptide maturase [Ruminococcus sp.]|nr:MULTISPECIES: thioether cross-link-forming SCIFF peptide maturase [Ruminococcus]MCI5617376.1 thioether cross-link-forming SCIFF peptide maturase [Ruminococcus sp.]MDD5890056.1 thioether cross-link-forming SCIFF peptide maturase [Ruminococcus sp.]MDD6532090.1 thioether cross-link-forming SCIFF peptide maturase [Ruminococcus sp.]MDD6709731.1 thioether cross-link-forming SCIFF peptide maturase [Ruminococcus sp.]MDY3662882.1 thioether cross-link-forming SCIFF peptide maturase [Ruminococcus bovi